MSFLRLITGAIIAEMQTMCTTLAEQHLGKQYKAGAIKVPDHLSSQVFGRDSIQMFCVVGRDSCQMFCVDLTQGLNPLDLRQTANTEPIKEIYAEQKVVLSYVCIDIKLCT